MRRWDDETGYDLSHRIDWNVRRRFTPMAHRPRRHSDPD